MNIKTALAAAAAIALGASGALAQLQLVPAMLTNEQADHGQEIYRNGCQGCHGGTMSGGPGGMALIGATFRAKWRGQPAEALFRYIRDKMPPGNAGSLGDAAYADLTAAILRANGVKPGAVPLPADPARLAGLGLAEVLPADTSLMEGKPRPVALPPDAVATEAMERRAAQLKALRPVTDEMLAHPGEGEWLGWRNGHDAHGYSKLGQVNRDNVRDLQLAWSWQFGPSANQIAPLVHDGVMFMAGGGRLQAIDAASGDLLWQYERPEAGMAVRSIAIYGDLIYYSAGVEVHAIDMRDGHLVWKRALAGPKDGLYITTGPLAAKGKVFQGMGGCSAPYLRGCFVAALDARTGEELWRFHTIAQPGERGGDTWNGVSADQRLGGSVWTPGSYDPELDLLFIGTGQTYHVSPLLAGNLRDPAKASGLFTNSTLALRPDSGELVWYYQHMPRDVFDLDWAFERTLATIDVNGKPRRTVTTIGKTGIGDVLDAATGRYIRSFQTAPQNVVASIDPRTGRKTPGIRPRANVDEKVCPSAFGGRNWPATAYDPASKVLFVPSNEACMIYQWTPGPVFDMSFQLTRRPDSDGKIGRVDAIDLTTGKSIWTLRERSPSASGILATAGGLIFRGSRDRWFRALDQRTGEVLWQTRLDGAINGFPIAFAVDGVQYVAVTTGGTGSLDMFLTPLAPEIRTTPTATTLWVFRLPKR